MELSCTVAQLLGIHGSFRLLCDAYWRGLLPKEHEKAVENEIPKEILIGFKPIA